MRNQSPLQEAVNDLSEGMMAHRGLTKDELAALRQSLKAKGFKTHLKYITSPKYAYGQVRLRPTARQRDVWTEQLFERFVRFLIDQGFMSIQTSLEKYLSASIWFTDFLHNGLYVYKVA